MGSDTVCRTLFWREVLGNSLYGIESFEGTIHSRVRTNALRIYCRRKRFYHTRQYIHTQMPGQMQIRETKGGVLTGWPKDCEESLKRTVAAFVREDTCATAFYIGVASGLAVWVGFSILHEDILSTKRAVHNCTQVYSAVRTILPAANHCLWLQGKPWKQHWLGVRMSTKRQYRSTK